MKEPTIDIEKDDRKQWVTIEGIRYSYSLFRDLGCAFPLNMPFKIIERGDGTISIERLK